MKAIFVPTAYNYIRTTYTQNHFNVEHYYNRNCAFHILVGAREIFYLCYSVCIKCVPHFNAHHLSTRVSEQAKMCAF